VGQDPGAQPLRKVDLRIIGGKDSGANAITATTDAEGKFQIEALPPGRYHVTEFLKAYEERGLKVQVEEGSRKNVSVKLVSDNVAQ
jgi:hypothetical protein